MAEVRVSLNKRTVEKLTLSDVLTRFEPELKTNTIGLFYTPKACLIVKLKTEDERIVVTGEKSVPVGGSVIDTVYEARFFNEIGELRWLRGDDNAGTAVWIYEDAVTTDTKSGRGNLIPHDQQYLLWGQGTGTCESSWSEMGEARIGCYFIPLDNIKHNKRVVLKAKEYIGEDEYGNAYVAEERLIGLEVYRDAR